MVRILLSVLQFRVNARYVEADPPFTGIGEWCAGCCGAGSKAAVLAGSRWGNSCTLRAGNDPLLLTSTSALLPLLPSAPVHSGPVHSAPLNPLLNSPRLYVLCAELDISDSGREGCAVSTLTITSEPKDWRGATAVAVQEVRRLQRFGVTRGELERYKTALMRDRCAHP
jgi:hypothetical protein